MTTHDRIAKLFIDAERAEDITQARTQLHRTPIQLVVGADVPGSETLQITSLIAADTARRAFPSGVVAVLADNGPARTTWNSTRTFSESLQALGVELIAAADDRLPTIAIGAAPVAVSNAHVVRTVPRGWSGGVVPGTVPAPRWRPGTLGAMLAGALAVAELFSAVHEINPRSGRRSTGLSVWNPSLPWDSDHAAGPDLESLPSRLWLLGLGHLGQAYAWLLRTLPYADPATALIALQDTDRAAEENIATQLLTAGRDIGERKTRIVAKALEAIGMQTMIIERRFDDRQRRHASEPSAALIGVDNHDTRRQLSTAGWSSVIDVGLGAHADDFTQILLHRVGHDAPTLFAASSANRSERLQQLPAYRRLADADPCGAVIAAGEAVGTSFVGAVAAVMAIAELLRPIHGGQAHAVWQANLRSPADGAYVPRPPAVTDRLRETTDARLLHEGSADGLGRALKS